MVLVATTNSPSNSSWVCTGPEKPTARKALAVATKTGPRAPATNLNPGSLIFSEVLMSSHLRGICYNANEQCHYEEAPASFCLIPFSQSPLPC